jgi:GNAT superfamily N-acetyltransferase
MKLRDVQTCLRSTIEARATTVGPFLVLINDSSANPFLNYAVPVDGAAPTADDVARLVAYFTERDRLPRLEYVRPAPAVDTPLREAGFNVDATLGLMAVDQLSDTADAPGYRVSLVVDKSGLRQAVAVQNTAYGEGDNEPDTTGLERTIRDGGCVALAVETATGAPAGAGLCTPEQGGMVEIAGVGVLPGHRRHGVGRVVTAALTAEAFRRGYQPFLQVEKDEPARLYERIGYRRIGEMADARRPVRADRPIPRVAGDERETLLVFLDYVREGLISKLAGLDAEDARTALVPSGTNLLWLVKHTMTVELFWLHHAFGGLPESELLDDELTPEDSPAAVIAQYRALANRSAELVGKHPDLGELGAIAPFAPPAHSLRWTLTHLVEETSRHAGHADILREQLDGRTGR